MLAPAGSLHCLGARGSKLCHPACPHSSQRSGRIPALPYPLPEHFYFTTPVRFHLAPNALSTLAPVEPFKQPAPQRYCAWPDRTTCWISASRSAPPEAGLRHRAKHAHASALLRATAPSAPCSARRIARSPGTNDIERSSFADCSSCASARSFSFRSGV